ncbi:formate dehydrogenase accessory sulfurtransferase FdhD [uncultured Maricaulis sp.]|uniref:formate dehydrogenase accessory sulfurtransferase FdhD n=1 Tax=uncultured Maricaulis sp. TaxID=174710 RepID=UPI0030DB17F0
MASPSIPVSRRASVYSSAPVPRGWGIAEEVPVEIGFNGTAWTVMMATPADIEDLAIGLALTEGAVAGGRDIDGVDVRQWPEGLTADIRIAPELLRSERVHRRALDGRTGCGLCGIEKLADLQAPPVAVPPGPVIAPTAIRAALGALPDHQHLNRETRSVHGAAWCRTDGEIILVREDVGRHNALDKLAGARLRHGETTDEGFVVMSSRCSFELVFKAARMRAALLAAQSAPTGRALDLAQRLSLPIAATGSRGAIVFFAPERADE